MIISQLGWWHSQYMESHKTCSKPPITSDDFLQMSMDWLNGKKTNKRNYHFLTANGVFHFCLLWTWRSCVVGMGWGREVFWGPIWLRLGFQRNSCFNKFRPAEIILSTKKNAWFSLISHMFCQLKNDVSMTFAYFVAFKLASASSVALQQLQTSPPAPPGVGRAPRRGDLDRLGDRRWEIGQHPGDVRSPK